MSGIGETEEKPVTEQDGAIPDTVVPAEPVVETPAEETAAPAAEATEGEPRPPKAQPWFQKRIDELTKARRDAERNEAAATARAAALEAAEQARNAPEDGTASKPVLTQADFDKAVEAKAAQLAAAKEVNARAQTWLEAGVKEYGGSEFNERCALVASLGAEDRPDFMQVVTDPEIIPDGHKLVAKLAEYPEEAQRILGISDKTKMTAALLRFDAAQAQPVKEVSRAPKPISPIGGSARASAPSDTDDIKTWVAKRNAYLAAKAAGTTH